MIDEITDKQVQEARDLIREKDRLDQIARDLKCRREADLLENTFWRGPCTGFADKNGVRIIRSISRSFDYVTFEVINYAHAGYYSMTHQHFYGMAKDMVQITEDEYKEEFKRFTEKIGLTL